MEPTFLKTIANYRLIIGLLGEKEHFGWWQSAFFTEGSAVFLSPIFSRTQLLAQCNGVTRAAMLVHDERIGVGHVYHLFRLPEYLEQGLHQVLQQPEVERNFRAVGASRETALSYLRTMAKDGREAKDGPVRVGGVEDLQKAGVWTKVASYYLKAFEQGAEVFPYFSELA